MKPKQGHILSARCDPNTIKFRNCFIKTDPKVWVGPRALCAHPRSMLVHRTLSANLLRAPLTKSNPKYSRHIYAEVNDTNCPRRVIWERGKNFPRLLLLIWNKVSPVQGRNLKFFQNLFSRSYTFYKYINLFAGKVVRSFWPRLSSIFVWRVCFFIVLLYLFDG